MRQITEHETDAAQPTVEVKAVDEPGQGNACHTYQIKWDDKPAQIFGHSVFKFQDGPIKEAGRNGVTDEALLAIVLDRLKGFQTSGCACQENEFAIMHLKSALQFLHDRTMGRIARGVEGTHTP